LEKKRKQTYCILKWDVVKKKAAIGVGWRKKEGILEFNVVRKRAGLLEWDGIKEQENRQAYWTGMEVA
jgi:hypothetical protein